MEFKQINWISSFPKSGNTWLRLLLDGYFLGEVDINDIQTSHGDAAQFFYQLDNLPATRYAAYYQQLIRPSALIKMVMHWQNSGKVWPMFLKSHFLNAKMQSVSLYPLELTRSIIYLVRDPRDILPSYAAHMGMDIDTAIKSMSDDKLILTSSVKQQVDGFLSSWGNHVRSFTNANEHNVLLVRYEDMKEFPDKALAAVLNHIGVDQPCEGKIAKAVKMTEMSKMQKQEQEQGFGEKSDNEGQFFGKKHKPLTVKQRRQVEKIFAREMKMLGYLE